jgi:hypothetical protein
MVRAIAARTKGQVVSFGGYVTAYARARGMPLDRVSLQILGAELIASLGHEKFLDSVLADKLGGDETNVLIFDGVRHRGVWEAVQARFSGAILVGLECSATERLERLVLRESASVELSGDVIGHDMDRSVDDVLLGADVIVRTDRISAGMTENIGMALADALMVGSR